MNQGLCLVLLLVASLSFGADTAKDLPKLPSAAKPDSGVKAAMDLDVASLQRLVGRDPSVKVPSADDQKIINAQLSSYLSFLGFAFSDTIVPPPALAQASLAPRRVTEDSPDPSAEGGASKNKAFQRLFSSSLQFLSCNFTDWACLEKPSLLTPKETCRRPAPQDVDQLGAPIKAGNTFKLGNDFEIFFTHGWSQTVAQFTPEIQAGHTVASELGKRMSEAGVNGLKMAAYGFDDLDGSMKPVFDGIKNINSRFPLNVQAVFDRVDNETLAPGMPPWIFSYVAPGKGLNSSPDATDRWMLSPSKLPNVPAGTLHTEFQYSDTARMAMMLNEGIDQEEFSRGRFEWPDGHIMHDKFIVVSNPGRGRSVWTGTANLSNHCMGAERNNNMSIYIRNDAIAGAFEDEFKEMFNFRTTDFGQAKDMVGAGNQPIKIGSFHHNKKPNTHRLFQFTDGPLLNGVRQVGTQVRVHFAPTDDAEHRVILPMLLSARPGDKLRISMFGNSGFEIVRAIQFAVANGADVSILLDSQQGAGSFSWLNAPSANLKQLNPYLAVVKLPSGARPGRLVVKTSNFPGEDANNPGKNHQKTATLTRRVPTSVSPDGWKPEVLIIGSQNWSTGGNDENDENLISIQNLTAPLEVAKQYNDVFDRTFQSPLLRLQRI